MKKWWAKKKERWAAQFLYSLSDKEFDTWVRNVTFFRNIRKNFQFDEVSQARPLPSAEGRTIRFQ